MLIRTFSLVIPLLMLSAASHAEELQVTFQLHAPELPMDTTVYITGSHAKLGNWHPSRVTMQSTSDHQWIYTFTLEKPQTLEYKYTLGSWHREGADATGTPLKNFSLKVDKSIVQEDRVSFWTKRQYRMRHGQITGKVRYHLKMKGEGIPDRDIIVWLPPGYDESLQRYPVLYMHDGQNIVDPKTSAFGVDWQVDETCTRLIKSGAIEPLIVVGIYNTRSRGLEYYPGPKGTAYQKFIIEELKPFIDATYRTKPGRDSTFTGGSSAGGICAFMLVWEYSQVFSKAICMSPAFQFENRGGKRSIDYVKTVRESSRPSGKVYFYIDNGGIGLEENLQPGVDDMLAALKEKGFDEKKDYLWVHAPEARHTESAWAKRFPQAIQALMAD